MSAAAQKPKDHAGTTNPAKESLRKEQKEQREAERKRGKNDELDKALADTFPASDPVALETPTRPGGRKPD